MAEGGLARGRPLGSEVQGLRRRANPLTRRRTPKDLRDQPLVKGVSASLDADAALERDTKQREIAHEIQRLVPDELVRKTQPPRVDHAGPVEDHGVVQVSATAKPGLAQAG